MRKFVARLVVATGLICISSAAWAELAGPRPSVNPATYSSPSGEFSFFVNPTDLFGRGPADYRFTKSGEVVWTKQLPFTAYDAAISDSGHVIVYAYTHGLDGFSEAGYKAGMGDFVVAIFSSKGDVILKETYPREGGRYEDAVPNPEAKSIIVDGFGKHAIIRVADSDNRQIEKWWVYDLGSGKRMDTVEPDKPEGGKEVHFSIIAAKAVPGTPLVLTNWWKYDSSTSQSGAVFMLVEPKEKSVWSLKLDNDYSVPSDEKKEDEIRNLILKEGAILDVRANGAFDLHFVKDRLRVSYAVSKQSPGKWEVKKTGQVPFAQLMPEPKFPPFPALTLKKLGETALSTGIVQKDRPIRDIESFEFDPEGRICALRAGRDDVPSLLFLSQEGKVLSDLRLPIQEIPEHVKYSNPANVGDSRFVVSVSSQAVGSLAQWFLADFDAGTIKKMESSECPTVDAVAGFSDGRFSALTTRHVKYTSAEGIYFFDPNGKVIWKKEQDGYSGKPDDLLSPADIATYGANGIAILDTIRHTIQIFDTKGNLTRTLDLEKAWGREPNYLTDLAPDHDAGFLVYDFNAKKTFVRMDGKGAILAEAVPKLSDGSPFHVVDGVKRSPQGDLWTSDGDSIFRLSANHTVNLILGQEPKPSSLSEPCCVEIGSDDRIYVGDRRTKTTHVFDSSGSAVGRCIPKPEDLTELSGVEHITVSRAGDIYVSLDLSGTKYLHFRKDMTREGWVQQVGADKICQKWYFQPTSDRCWVVGYNNIFLMENFNKIIQKISRRADGRWLEYPDDVAVASDGSLVVLARSQSGTHSINTYNPSGEAQSTFDLPFELYTIEKLSYDGQHVFIRVENNVFVYGRDGHAIGQFTLPSEAKKNGWSGPYLAAKGRELWFVEGQGMKLHRYAVPMNFEKESV